MRDTVDEFSDAESAGPDVLAAVESLNESIGEPSFAEHLANLLDAVESLLETWRYPEKMDAGDPVCTVHPDAMVALEEAYDRYTDAVLVATDDAVSG